MKKLFVLLLSLAAAWSCKMNGSYSYTNCQDFVTLDKGSLINDYGAVYFISQVESDKVPVPTESGRRYYLFFDILNSYGEILLKNSLPVSVLQPLPVTDPAPESHDPVSIVLSNISPNWLNLGISYYKVKGSEFVHSFSVQYEQDDASDNICFNLYHDGNDENPASVADGSSLEQETKMLSIPLTGYDWTPTGLLLTCHVLQPKDEGGYEVVQKTYTSDTN